MKNRGFCEALEITKRVTISNGWNWWKAKLYLYDLLPRYPQTGCVLLMKRAVGRAWCA